MGVSTDAILAFGFDLGEDAPEALTSDDFDEFIAKDLGLIPPDHANYDSQEWKDHWAAQRAAVATYPVELVTHCSGEYPMYFLAVRSTYQKARRGYPVQAKFDQPTDDQIASLRAFCEKHGVDWQEPSWHIFSYWG